MEKQRKRPRSSRQKFQKLLIVFLRVSRYLVPGFWIARGCSSAGRALRSQRRGREFDPPQLHKETGRFPARPGEASGTGAYLDQLTWRYGGPKGESLNSGMCYLVGELFGSVSYVPRSSPAQQDVAQPRQVRKEATVGKEFCVTQGRLTSICFRSARPTPDRRPKGILPRIRRHCCSLSEAEKHR